MSDHTPTEKPPDGSPERRAHDMAEEILTGNVKPYWRGRIRGAIDQRDAIEAPTGRDAQNKALGRISRG